MVTAVSNDKVLIRELACDVCCIMFVTLQSQSEVGQWQQRGR
jgi:hypothetical protein